MKKDRPELKREMIKLAEERIEELLDWREKTEQPTLSEIENEVLRWRQKVSEGITQQLIENQEQVKPEGGVVRFPRFSRHKESRVYYRIGGPDER